MDNRFLLSCSYKMSDVLSDKFSARRIHRAKVDDAKCLRGLERPQASLWPRHHVQKWGRSSQHGVLPTSKLSVAQCATSSPANNCSIAQVNPRVTDRVICVFHAPVTLHSGTAHWCSPYRSYLRPQTETFLLSIKEDPKTEKSKKIVSPDLQETVVSFIMVESPPSSLYLPGNIQTGKSKKKLQSLSEFARARAIHETWLFTQDMRAHQALRGDSARTPLTYIRNIQNGKREKNLCQKGHSQKYNCLTGRLCMTSRGVDRGAGWICLPSFGRWSSRLQGCPPLLWLPNCSLLARKPRTLRTQRCRQFKEIKRLSLLWIKYACETKEYDFLCFEPSG